MSPPAPKTTIAHGSAGGTCCRCGMPTAWVPGDVSIGCLFGMALFRGVLCHRMGLPFFRFRFRISGLLTLYVTTETEPHRRQHLFSEVMLLPRAESGVKRDGQHVRRDRFLDRSLDGPATLAGILDVPGELLQLRILRVLVAQDVEAFRVRLHQSVLDAVMHHFDEMPGAGWPGVNVAPLGLGDSLLAAGCTRNIAQSGSKRREDRFEMIYSLLRAADHQTVAALNTPDAAGGAAIDVANMLVS